MKSTPFIEAMEAELCIVAPINLNKTTGTAKKRSYLTFPKEKKKINIFLTI